MPGHRKVRVFHDPKKSPNWYVELRDAQGRRRSESCGPRKVDADKRAAELERELAVLRTARRRPPASGHEGVPVQAVIKAANLEWPVEIVLRVDAPLRQLLERLVIASPPSERPDDEEREP